MINNNFFLTMLWIIYSHIFLQLSSLALSDESNWWKHAIIYELLVPSYQDSDGDGFGDFKGIDSRLDHLVDIGVDAVWFTPCYPSPMVDMGYDISNYTNINPMFGTLNQFDDLVNKMKRKGLKVLLDFVVNHSSDKHPWFEKSINRVDPYTDYYLWVDPKGYDADGTPMPPNNWKSIITPASSAWRWNSKRRQFYFTNFLEQQPELNFRNDQVQREVKDILKFWLDRGIHGLRIDTPDFYVEDILLRDEPILESSKHKSASELTYFDLKHIYTLSQPESYQLMRDFRELVDKVNYEKGGPQRILLSEVVNANPKVVIAYAGNASHPQAHVPLNFVLELMLEYPNSTKLDSIIRDWLDSLPPGLPANWLAETHDRFRTNGHYTDEYVDIMATIILMLPGIGIIYYGQELGMPMAPIRPDQSKDLCHALRDNVRSPMQWDSTFNAGFTSKLKPWLPVNPNYWRINVENEKREPNSHYNVFTALSRLKKTKTAKYGDLESYIISEWVYAFTRSLKGSKTYLTVLNLGTEMEIVDLSIQIKNLPPILKVEVASINAGYTKGDKIKSRPRFPEMLIMRPLSSLVLSYRKL